MTINYKNLKCSVKEHVHALNISLCKVYISFKCVFNFKTSFTMGDGAAK